MNYAVTLLVFNADGSDRILSISRGPDLDDGDHDHHGRPLEHHRR